MKVFRESRTSPKLFAAVIAIFSMASLASLSALGGPAAAINDAALTAEVKARLLADETTRSININVDTAAGAVTLRGTAPTEEARIKADEITANVEGVQAVSDQLIVGDSSQNPQTAIAKAKQAAAKAEGVASDSWITTKVKSQLLADPDVKGSDINVSTHDGVVTLAGALPSKEMRNKAVTIALNVKGVRKVNLAALRAPS